jgi:hypothetical protein
MNQKEILIKNILNKLTFSEISKFNKLNSYKSEISKEGLKVENIITALNEFKNYFFLFDILFQFLLTSYRVLFPDVVLDNEMIVKLYSSFISVEFYSSVYFMEIQKKLMFFIFNI